MPTAEQLARKEIDALLTAVGWAVQDVSATNIHAARGVAIREFPYSFTHQKFLDVSLAAIEASYRGAGPKVTSHRSNRYSIGASVRPQSREIQTAIRGPHFDPPRGID